jgi:hypothetical protein
MIIKPVLGVFVISYVKESTRILSLSGHEAPPVAKIEFDTMFYTALAMIGDPQALERIALFQTAENDAYSLLLLLALFSLEKGILEGPVKFRCGVVTYSRRHCLLS